MNYRGLRVTVFKHIETDIQIETESNAFQSKVHVRVIYLIHVERNKFEDV